MLKFKQCNPFFINTTCSSALILHACFGIRPFVFIKIILNYLFYIQDNFSGVIIIILGQKCAYITDIYVICDDSTLLFFVFVLFFKSKTGVIMVLCHRSNKEAWILYSLTRTYNYNQIIIFQLHGFLSPLHRHDCRIDCTVYCPLVNTDCKYWFHRFTVNLHLIFSLVILIQCMFVDDLTNHKTHKNVCFATITYVAQKYQPLSKVLKMCDPPCDVYMSTRDYWHSFSSSCQQN